MFAAAVLSAVALACTGCTSSATRDGSGPAPAEFRRNITTWSRPLDPYTVTSTDEQYAQALVYSACMRKSGYVVPVVNPANFVPPNISKQGYKLFDSAIARQYGYHNGPTLQRPTADAAPGEGTTASARCTDEANKAINNPYGNFVQNLRAVAYGSALHAAHLDAASRRWHACMLPLGLADLPETPDGMPTLRLARTWGLTGPADPASDDVLPQTSASLAEIRVATKDAACRASSTWTSTLYDEQITAQQALIRQNDQKLAEAYAAAVKESATVARTLERYGR